MLLNHAVAVAMARGPAAGLALVDQLQEAGSLTGYYLLPATRADLLRRMARNPEAAIAYRQALDLAPTNAERRFLVDTSRNSTDPRGIEGPFESAPVRLSATPR